MFDNDGLKMLDNCPLSLVENNEISNNFDLFLSNYGSISLGIIAYEVDVVKDNADLWDYLNQKVIPFAVKNYQLDSVQCLPEIIDARNLYRSIGKDPHKYRVSSEALIRRILQGKDLYNVNNIVDINNLISIDTLYSVGSYDLDNIDGDVVFRIGQPGERYKGIGKDIVNIENLPVFATLSGPYGSPTSYSEKAMITLDSKHIMTVLISFNNNESRMIENIEKSKKYIRKYSNARNISSHIVKNY